MVMFHLPKVTPPTGGWATDSKEYIFLAVLTAIYGHSHQAVPSVLVKNPDQAVNRFVREHGMVVVMRDHENNPIVYSLNYRNRLPQEFIQRAVQILLINPDMDVGWSDDVFKTPRPYPAREVIWNQKVSRPPSASKGTVKQRWAHPDELTPEELSYLMGKSEKPPTP